MPIEQDLINAAMAYGRALERLENARAYMREIPVPPNTLGVRVEWSWGTATRGYKEMAEFVSGFVERSMKTNLEAAVHALHVQARDAGAHLDKLRKQFLTEM